MEQEGVDGGIAGDLEMAQNRSGQHMTLEPLERLKPLFDMHNEPCQRMFSAWLDYPGCLSWVAIPSRRQSGTSAVGLLPGLSWARPGDA